MRKSGEYLFYKNKEVIQLPNAIDVKYFNNCGVLNQNYLKKELKKDSSCLIICQIGRFFTAKNHKFSIQLVLKLKDKNINFHLVFAGDGKLKAIQLK